jgi:hypothetical protein
MHTTLKGAHVSYFFDEGTPTRQRRDAALREWHKSNKELLSPSFFPIASENRHFGQEHHDMGRQSHPYHDTWGLPGLG